MANSSSRKKTSHAKPPIVREQYNFSPTDIAVKTLGLPEAEKIVGLPLDEWDGNCHGVSAKLASRVRGTVRRGYFKGFVHPDSFFGRGLGQHSWIELDDGRVLDPTRHAIDLSPRFPFWVGPADDYDVGGCRSQAPVGPVPGVYDDEEAKTVSLDLQPESVDYVLELLDGHEEGYSGDDYVEVTFKQAHYLAHLPICNVERDGWMSSFYAPEIFEALVKAGFQALIPIDRLHWMLPEYVPSYDD